VIEPFRCARIHEVALAIRLQEEVARSFGQLWGDLLEQIAQKSAQLQAPA
jgi:hypothetical protein